MLYARVVSVAILSFALVSGVYARFYTLEQVLSSSLNTSTVLQIAKRKIEHTELVIQRVYSSAYPGIGLSLDALRVTDPLLSTGLVTAINSGSDQLTSLLFQNQQAESGAVPPANMLAMSMVLRQPLFLQGKIRYGIKSGRASQHVAVCHYEEVKKTVVAETKKCYYRVLLERDRLTFNKEKFALLQEKSRIVNVAYRLGHVQSIDTLHSRIVVEKGRLELLHAQSDYKKAVEALIVQSGIVESPATLWLEDKMPEPVFFITIAEAVAEMQENNSTLRQFKGIENIAEYKLLQEKMRLLPEVWAGAAYHGGISLMRSAETAFTRQRGFGAVFAELSWQLFSGFSTKNAIETAKNEFDQLLLEHQQEMDAIELRVRALYEDIVVAQHNLEVLKQVLTLSEMVAAEEQYRNRSGLSTIIDTKVSDLALLEARQEYTMQLYLFHCALIDFRFLIGSPV